MTVLYAYESDAADPMVQSGRPLSILRQLERRTDGVIPAFPLKDGLKYLYSAHYAANRLRGRTYRPDREPALLRAWARQIEHRAHGADWIFSPGSRAITAVRASVPMIFCADATFQNMLDCYDEFSRCSRGYLKQGYRQEKAALDACAAALYPSDWAARSAIEDYGTDPAKVHVVPFGANITPPDPDQVEARIAGRSPQRLRLLFIGRDWVRKGGGIVLAAGEILRRRGLDLQLDLVGIAAPPVPLPPFAVNHGLLNKRVPAQAAMLERLLAEAHFLFVPSRAEAYGMVFCEAAAHGVPSVATRAGGIPAIVRHGETGICLDPACGPDDYADAIERSFTAWPDYLALARRSADAYRTRLNWDSFTLRLLEIAAAAIGQAPPLHRVEPLQAGRQVA